MNATLWGLTTTPHNVTEDGRRKRVSEGVLGKPFSKGFPDWGAVRRRRGQSPKIPSESKLLYRVKSNLLYFSLKSFQKSDMLLCVRVGEIVVRVTAYQRDEKDKRGSVSVVFSVVIEVFSVGILSSTSCDGNEIEWS